MIAGMDDRGRRRGGIHLALVQDAGQAKVCDPEPPRLGINEYIRWFKVPVDDGAVVEVSRGHAHLLHQCLDGFQRDDGVVVHKLVQVAARIVKHHVEGADGGGQRVNFWHLHQRDDVWMIEAPQD